MQKNVLNVVQKEHLIWCWKKLEHCAENIKHGAEKIWKIVETNIKYGAEEKWNIVQEKIKFGAKKELNTVQRK